MSASALTLELPFNLTVDLLALAHVAAAGAVSIHALLRKRDVRAAIGWIGLAWLSPFLGPVLYYLFGINRVTRRASRLWHGRVQRRRRGGAGVGAAGATELSPGLGAIATVSHRLTREELTVGNALTILDSGDEAYPAMLAAIAGAGRSVLLASYIFKADATGRAFIDALAAARARGAEVRVLLDGIGSGYFACPAAQLLRAAGVPVARFLHDLLPWRMPFLNMRNHKKLLIVDGSVGFTGGLNIGDRNLSRLHPDDPIRDVHFRVEGPLLGHLHRAFAEDWHFTTGEILDGPAWSIDSPALGRVSARGICSGPDEDAGSLEAIFATALGAATRRVRIATPYFLPDDLLARSIALAALRGVDVEIVLPGKSDQRIVDWATRANLGFFVDPKIAIVEMPPPFDHSKLMTVDGEWFAVGSANWDVRSSRLNFEFVLECYDRATAAEIDRLIDRKAAKGRRLAPGEIGGRPVVYRLRDAAARLLLPYL
jgi:cardiolipin synthase